MRLFKKKIKKPSDESLYMASQWRLMWVKFRDHRVAHCALYMVAFFYVVAVFAEFIAPQDPRKRNAERNICPPQRVRLFHDGGLRWPFVYGVTRSRHPETLELRYQEDATRRYALRPFVKGHPYKLWGLIPWDRHLFGVTAGERVYLPRQRPTGPRPAQPHHLRLPHLRFPSGWSA